MGESPIGTRDCFRDMTLSYTVSTKVTANHMQAKREAGKNINDKSQ